MRQELISDFLYYLLNQYHRSKMGRKKREEQRKIHERPGAYSSRPEHVTTRRLLVPH